MKTQGKKLLAQATLSADELVARAAERYSVTPDAVVLAGLVVAKRTKGLAPMDARAAAAMVSGLFPDLFATADPDAFFDPPPPPPEPKAGELTADVVKAPAEKGSAPS